MFEIIGLAVSTFALCIFSGIVSVVYTGLAAIILRNRPDGRSRRLLVAAVLPVACAGYLIVTAVVITFLSDGKTDMLFGDIHEPLPNGYILTGLGKMHEYADIIRPFSSDSDAGTFGVHGIQGITADGPIVYGAFSHEFDNPARNGEFFIFDTRTGVTTTLTTKRQLDDAAKHNVQLLDPQDFRSQDSRHRLLARTEHIVSYGPPLALLVLYLLYLVGARTASVRHG
jgi:hypothetical protein